MTDRTRARHGDTQQADARRRLDASLSAGEVGTFEWDVVEDRLWGNETFARLFGIELDDSGAAPLSDYIAVIHPDDRDRVVERIDQSVRTGDDFEAEYRIAEGGHVRWVIARSKADRDDDGRVVRFAGVVLDVTGRKEAEAALGASETRYRALFETMDEGFCIIHVLFDAEHPYDYRFVEMNPAFEHHTGLRNAVGRTAREILPDLEQHWFDIYGRVASTGQPTRFESGSDVMGRWFDVYAFRIGPAQDRQVALLFKDISEQKRTAAVLMENRERLQAVLENSLDAAYRRNLQGNGYDYLSPTVRHVLGMDPARLQTMPEDALVERVHPDDRDSVEAAMEEGIRSGRGRVEYRLRTDEGDYRWLADHFTVQTDEVGVPLWRTGIVRDVTDQKRTEAELQAAKEAAEAASQAKTQFLAVMSHELRTPLTGVIGFADLLETEVLGPMTGQQQDSLSRIKASAWHLIGIIDEILTLSRVEAGSEEVRVEEVDVAEVIRDVVRILEPQAVARGLNIQLDGVVEVARIRTDAGKVRQVLINLVSNAVKYTREGNITVRVDRDGVSRLEVHVRDTGPGIAPENLERIFEPFTQVDASHTRVASGTGLGLAICRRLARLLGGDVLVRSEPGAGSTFTLQLPG
jgi:PAS domain S-box-containing protein